MYRMPHDQLSLRVNVCCSSACLCTDSTVVDSITLSTTQVGVQSIPRCLCMVGVSEEESFVFDVVKALTLHQRRGMDFSPASVRHSV